MNQLPDASTIKQVNKDQVVAAPEPANNVFEGPVPIEKGMNSSAAAGNDDKNMVDKKQLKGSMSSNSKDASVYGRTQNTSNQRAEESNEQYREAKFGKESENSSQILNS